MSKAAVARHTVRIPPEECPIRSGVVEREYAASLKAARVFSAGVLDFLKSRSPDSQARWAGASVEAGRVLFQPWTMEILFVLAVSRRARFSELQSLLGGISSRTLSDKLQTLKAEGLVDRIVLDEQPVRIEYALTKEGLTTAALATPLFAHLNERLRA